MQRFQSRFDSLPNPGEDWLPMLNREMLAQVLQPLPPGAKVLEIGSWLGRSACFILEVNPSVELHCIDVWEDLRLPKEEIEEAADECYSQFRDNLAQLGFLDKVHTLRDTSRNVLDHFQEGTLDVIYIDGSHEEEDVYHDFHNAYKLLKLKGHVVGDDWNWNSVSKGVMRAFWEINETEERFFPIRSAVTAYHTFKQK